MSIQMVSGFPPEADSVSAFWSLHTGSWLMASGEKPEAENDEPFNQATDTRHLCL